MLETAVKLTDKPPRYIISVQGSQFQADYRDWCKSHGITPRFGAIGRYGSIALRERFMRTLKSEGLRRLLVIPLSERDFTSELNLFVDWYNEHRPHQGLKGATPNESFFGRIPALDAPRLEPREGLRGSTATTGNKPDDRARGSTRATNDNVVTLHVLHHHGRAHLPVLELVTRAA